MAGGLEFRIHASDKILSRFGNQLQSLANGMAAVVLARALNHEGDKARTQVKRVLVKQTGINYNLVEKAVSTYRANSGKLSYTIQARGSETNLGLFHARQTRSGVSAAPWGTRRIFTGPHGASFFMPGTDIVVVRTGEKYVDKHGKIKDAMKPLYGPNIARELLKDETRAAWKRVSYSLADRVGHELSRVLQH